MVAGVSGASLQLSVDGDKSEPVIGSYNSSRQQLLNHYKESLNGAKDIVLQAQRGLHAEKNELFEPLPANIDVHSPDFSYREFSSESRDVRGFGGKVAEERKKLDPNQPSGIVDQDNPIRRRLSG